jgi:ribosomal protein L33
MQFKASLSGASSGSGNEGWCRRINRRLVTARMRVSRFCKAMSRVLLMSAGENKLKISSVDSGSSQNYVVYRSANRMLKPARMAYRCPVWIIGRDVFIL